MNPQLMALETNALPLSYFPRRKKKKRRGKRGRIPGGRGGAGGGRPNLRKGKRVGGNKHARRDSNPRPFAP